MSSASSIALSGLAAAQVHLDASAHDVANALTEGYVPLRVDQEEVAGGGAVATVTREQAEAEARADATLTGLATVDLGRELVGQLRAARAYEASLAVLRAAGEAERSLLDVVG